MAKRPPCPPNMPWLSPYLTVRDVAAAADFYEKAFGFEKSMTMPGPDGQPVHGEVRWHDMVIMFGKEGAFGCTTKTPANSGAECPLGLYFYVDDVDAAFKRAVDAGCTAKTEPETMFWGDRMGTVEDPDGYGWTLATNVADFDPAKTPGC